MKLLRVLLWCLFGGISYFYLFIVVVINIDHANNIWQDERGNSLVIKSQNQNNLVSLNISRKFLGNFIRRKWTALAKTINILLIISWKEGKWKLFSSILVSIKLYFIYPIPLLKEFQNQTLSSFYIQLRRAFSLKVNSVLNSRFLNVLTESQQSFSEELTALVSCATTTQNKELQNSEENCRTRLRIPARRTSKIITHLFFYHYQ